MNWLNHSTQAAAGRFSKRAAGLLLLLGLLGPVNRGVCGEAPALTESQVKALCLLNFAKYTEWPADVFAATNSPIIIGVVGGDKFADGLRQAVAGRTIGGRCLEVVPAAGDEDQARCQMLFIAASETKRQAEILKRVKTRPILTVGEADQFTQQGGVINFVKKDGKVRFEVDLNAAREARLQLSSKLLSLADVVTGKP